MLWSKFCFQCCVMWVFFLLVVFICSCCNWVGDATKGSVLGLKKFPQQFCDFWVWFLHKIPLGVEPKHDMDPRVYVKERRRTKNHWKRGPYFYYKGPLPFLFFCLFFSFFPSFSSHLTSSSTNININNKNNTAITIITRAKNFN